MKFSLSEEKLNIIDDQSILVSDFKVCAKFFDETEPLLADCWHKCGDEYICGNIKLDVRYHDQVMMWRITIENGSEKALTLSEISCMGVLRHPLKKCIHHELKCDVMPNMTQNVVTEDFDGKAACIGADINAVLDEVGGEWLLGYTTFRNYTNHITVKADGGFVLAQDTERARLGAGDVVSGDYASVMPVSDIRTALPKYAKMVRILNDEGYPQKERPIGWCSWYYYFDRVTPENVIENVDFLKKHGKEIPISYIQTDDGWLGEKWDPTPNAKFKQYGMREFARKITEEGFKPGIWLAPFTVLRDSMLAKEHPEWMVKEWDSDAPKLFDRFGFAMQCYVLDITNPAAEGYLRKLMHKVTHEWGYRYIKLDFMNCNMICGKRYDESLSSVMAYRKGLKIIRESITEDTYFLNCTAPFSSSVGLCDGMRISGDIFGDFRSLLGIFYQINKRYYMNYGMFNTDADCLIIRASDEEDAECGRGNTRNLTEIKTYITMMSASGGALMLSDKLTLLNKNKLEMIEALFPMNKETAIPHDLWENNIVGVLDFGIREKIHPIALTNWDWGDQDMVLPISTPKHLYEYWSGKYLGVHSSYTAHLSEHETQLFYCTDAKESLAIIGSLGCICPQIVQSSDNKILRATLPKADKYFMISPAMPKSYSGCKITAAEGGYIIDAHECDITITI